MKKKLIIINLIMDLLLSTLCVGCNNKDDANDAIRSTETEIRTDEEKVQDNTPILLKIATLNTPESIAYEGIEMFQEMVTSESDDSIEVQLYPSGQLGEQSTIMEGIRIGTVEMAFLPLNAAENYVSDLAEYEALISEEDEDVRIFLDEIKTTDILEQIIDSGNARCIGFSFGGIQNIWTKEPVYNAEDLDGLRIRVSEVPSFLNAFQNLGVSVSTISLSQTYDALQTNILDGVELDSESLLCYNLYESCKYCMETEHAFLINTFFISEEVFEDMTLDQQEIVQKVAEAASDWMTDQYLGQQEDFRNQLEEKGVAFYQPNLTTKQLIRELMSRTMEDE